MTQKNSFEKALNRLEEIVGKLESGDLSLDESLKIFQEGIELSRYCTKKLSEAESRVKKLVKTGSGKFRL
jgi:exodeoxyribonuclease VII small subunit